MKLRRFDELYSWPPDNETRGVVQLLACGMIGALVAVKRGAAGVDWIQQSCTSS